MRIVPATLAFLIAVPGIGWAQSTESERRSACTGDAFKLCASSIPDRGKVRDCLSTKRDQLTPDCRSVVDGGKPGRPSKG